jgi:DNA-binding transcriptional LysR family regulator
MDQLQAMRVFARVVETGSFTRTAEALDLPRATVSKLVQALESHLRVRLLNRTTRRVAVTPEGAAYYERTHRLLGELDEIDSGLSDAHAAPRGRLRVEMGSAMARLVVIPALADFQARYPDIRLELGVSDRPGDPGADPLDCVIRAGVLTEPSLVARRIGELPVRTYAAPAYLRRHGAPRRPEDLEDGHGIVGCFGCGGRAHPGLDFRRDGQRISVQGRQAVSVNEGSALLAAGLAGLGVVQLPAFLAQPHVEAGELVRVLEGWTSEPVPLHVVFPHNRHLGARVRAFVDWVADLFAGHALLGRPQAAPAATAGVAAIGPLAAATLAGATPGRSPIRAAPPVAARPARPAARAQACPA